MNIEKLNIPGVMLIKNNVNKDHRGSFFKPYSYEELIQYDININIKEVFYSYSHKNVIRGMHFQIPPFDQEKIVNVVKGKIIDVLLDLRIKSDSYGKFISIELTQNDGKSVYIPKGIAHGFLSISSYTIVLYMVNSKYSPNHDGGIRYDSFGYEWNVKNPILSSRDLSFENFDEFKSPFI